MATLWQIAQEAEVGDRIRWIGEKADVEYPKPREITEIHLRGNEIEVEADGPKSGKYGFVVTEDGDSEAWYRPPGGNKESQGEVVKAELVDKELFTEPWGE